ARRRRARPRKGNSPCRGTPRDVAFPKRRRSYTVPPIVSTPLRGEDTAMMTLGTEEDRAALMLRLKRIEGQLRGIQKMIADEAGCEQIAQQLSAARKSLDRAFFEMVACMLEHELLPEAGRKAQLRARIGEMTGLLARY